MHSDTACTRRYLGHFAFLSKIFIDRCTTARLIGCFTTSGGWRTCSCCQTFTSVHKNAGMRLQPGLWETCEGLLFVCPPQWLCAPVNLMKDRSRETAGRPTLIPLRPWRCFSLTLLAHDFQAFQCKISLSRLLLCLPRCGARRQKGCWNPPPSGRLIAGAPSL